MSWVLVWVSSWVLSSRWRPHWMSTSNPPTFLWKQPLWTKYWPFPLIDVSRQRTHSEFGIWKAKTWANSSSCLTVCDSACFWSNSGLYGLGMCVWKGIRWKERSHHLYFLLCCWWHHQCRWWSCRMFPFLESIRLEHGYWMCWIHALLCNYW